MSLRGRRALVTGAARRIGAAIARALAEEGCRLVLHAHRSRKEAHRLAAELRRKGADVDVLTADLEKVRGVEKLAREALRGGGVDLLINNAALYDRTPLKTLSSGGWDRVMAVNLRAPFLLSRILGLKMRKGGRILNLADMAGLRPYRNHLAYCVSKGALLSLTRGLARELAPKVSVNSLCPGPSVPSPRETSVRIRRIRDKIPLGRWGGEKAIAAAVVFLAKADFVTGANLVVDGGFELV